MNNVTLKQIRYFAALARHRHFGRAAAASAISQPALSMQIKELEDALATPLFERGGRSISLTGFGQTFAERAREILLAVDELGDLARASRDQLVGKLRIGVIPTIAPYLLPAFVAGLTDALPGIDLRIRETLTSRLIQELADGQLDAAIVALPISEPALTEVALFDEAFLLVRPAADAAKPAPDRWALRKMPLLLLEEGHCFRDQALAFCNMHGAEPRASLDASSLSTLVQMTGAGIGVTLIPEMAVAVETRSAAVSVVRLPSPEPSRTVGMIWRKTSPLAPRLQEVSDIVRTAAARRPAI